MHADATTARVAGDKWHTDVSCDEKPPLASILHMTTIPESGGDTLFSSMYAAYEALSDPLQRMLAGLTATHDGAPNYDDRAKRCRDGNTARVNPIAVHPVIATHPSTGRKTLYVNSAFTVRINELSKEESDAVLAFLFAHVARPEFQCRFHWQRHSIAFWDNPRCSITRFGITTRPSVRASASRSAAIDRYTAIPFTGTPRRNRQPLSGRAIRAGLREPGA